jgi:hypothetical protein
MSTAIQSLTLYEYCVIASLEPSNENFVGIWNIPDVLFMAYSKLPAGKHSFSTVSQSVKKRSSIHLFAPSA